MKPIAIFNYFLHLFDIIKERLIQIKEKKRIKNILEKTNNKIIFIFNVKRMEIALITHSLTEFIFKVNLKH